MANGNPNLPAGIPPVRPDFIDQRTPGGTILRSALDKVNALTTMIPEGKSTIAVAGYDKDGIQVGIARRTKNGWDIEAQLKSAVTKGRPGDITFVTRISF